MFAVALQGLVPPYLSASMFITEVPKFKPATVFFEEHSILIIPALPSDGFGNPFTPSNEYRETLHVAL